MKAIFSTSALVILLTASPAGAAELRLHPRAVLELFTSQGCSSCPEADARLHDLAATPDVIALAFHVDYWDYIGWADTFGSRANSDHQKAYAAAWGSSRIFTPELVINGQMGVVGSRAKEVDAALADAALSVPVMLALGDDMIDVDVGAQPGAADAMIWLVTFKDHAQVMIERGENAGKTMDYSQVVTSRQMLGMWVAATGTHLRLPMSQLTTGGANGAAILVQTGKGGLPGPILGAASLQL